jgi:hypothetical protein
MDEKKRDTEPLEPSDKDIFVSMLADEHDETHRRLDSHNTRLRALESRRRPSAGFFGFDLDSLLPLALSVFFAIFVVGFLMPMFKRGQEISQEG